MAPRKTPSADMAMMVMRMGSSVFSMLPGPLISLLSTSHADAVQNPNVVHGDVSPALPLYQTFDHHLEEK
ncbi:hypothetical protein CRUP_032111 [Coryphaenoides rupestris]|nr:hypothetical protein CRUP_032111 [Coryphaenoides rupestris]